MSATPHIDALLNLKPYDWSAPLAAEVRALLAERDEYSKMSLDLKLRLDAAESKLATLTAPPARTLRAYNGVTYDAKTHPCYPWQFKGGWKSAASLISAYSEKFTDADHAALLDLKANPWEDVPDRVVEIIQDAVDRAYDYGSRSFASEWEGTIELAQKTAADLRAIVRAEGGGK